MANLSKEQVKVAKSVSTKEQEGLSDQDQSILYYICGFIIRRLSKRYQTKCSSKRQCIQRLKLKTPNSTFVARFSNWKTKSDRGGLLTPCDELFLLVREFETVLRKLVNLNDLSSTSLLCDRLKESILECYMVKYYCEKLFGDCEESIQVSVLESILELFLTIRGYATTRVQRNKIAKGHVPKKQSAGLRKTLKDLSNKNC